MKDILLSEHEAAQVWRSDIYGEHWDNKENSLREQIVTLVTWQWDNNPTSILDAIKFWIEDEAIALEVLIQGQEGEWKEQYRVAVQDLPDFWRIVIYTPWLKPDFDTLELSLRWQVRTNWDSLWKSQSAWDQNPSSENVWAYYYLLSGQRSNSEALENYRACWYKDKNRVMAIVRELV